MYPKTVKVHLNLKSKRTIDAVHFSVREDNIVKKLAAYVILGLTADDRKDVISLQIGENESSKYWLGVLKSC